MRKVVLALTAMVAVCCANAQNSAIYKAEEYMNDGELQKAKECITPALTNPKTKLLAYAFNVAGTIDSKILQPEIEKAAARQELDTTLFIKSLYSAVDNFVQSDKYDMAPNEKGKVKSEYHQNNRKMVMQMLAYFAYAGQFENQRGNKDAAYEAFCKYMEAPKLPIFTKAETDSIYSKGKEAYNKIGYYATLLANDKKDYDAVLKTVDYAIADPSSCSDGYMLKLAALLSKQDTANWVKVSREAVAQIDDNPNFCNNLLYYYNLKNQTKEATEMANELVQKAPNNKMAWYARGCVNMNTLKKYVEAREDFDKALAIDDNFVEALYNKGVSYVNELISLNLNIDPKAADYKETVEKARGYYRQAQPLFERIQLLAPERKDLWANNLRNIYFNLDMKEKTKEMEALIPESK